MLLVQNKVVAIKDGLLEQHILLNKMLEKNERVMRTNADDAAIVAGGENVNKDIVKIKKVLLIVEKGLDFFNDTWIVKSGKNEGQVIKFFFLNPTHWSMIAKSIEYYKNLFVEIADVYKTDANNNGNTRGF